MRSDTSGSTASSLLRRAKLNDPEAWQRLCELYAPLVYRWARRLGCHEAHALDVGQEVFQVVVQRLGSFCKHSPGDSFRRWLWGVTRNKVREHHRRQTIGAYGKGGSAALDQLKQLAVGLAETSSDVEPANERSALMHRALMQIRPEFEPSTWEAFWRSTVDEQKSSDVAADLRNAAAAVRQAKYRVLRRLRNELSDLL